jgi:anti-sigma factor RsiW
MSHLDEGTLHALLDGELDTAETGQIEAHLGRCTICGTRLDEIKHVRTEADRLIESLESVPQSSTAPVATKPAAPPRHTPSPDAWAGPILLIPELPEEALRHAQRKRQHRWAAIIVLAVGATYAAIEFRQGAASESLAISDAGPTSAPVPASAPVLSPQEAVSQAAPAATSNDSAHDSTRNTVSDGARGSVAPSGAATSPAHDANLDELVTTATGQRASRAKASDTPAPDDARALRVAEQRQQQAAAMSQAPVAPPAVAQPAPVVVAPPVTTPAPPPSLEERAHIYLRIGLDEAARQLGGPVHGIEEMSPALIGLASGRLSPGMDSMRPVVRAVYVDPVSNRLIFLDQQRLRSEQSSVPPRSLRVLLGDVVVQLQGEPSANVLRNLMPRVR